MSEDSYAEGYAEGMAATLAELETGAWDGEDYGSPSEAVAAWSEGGVLDVDMSVTMSGHVRHVTLTTGVGGPGVYVRCYGDGHVRVRVAWAGSPDAFRYVDAPNVDAWAWELADMWMAERGVRA
jgi:hypothetical protein